MVKVKTVLGNAVVVAQEEDDAAELDCDEAVGVGDMVDAILVLSALAVGGTDEVT